MFIINFCLNMFRSSLCPSSGEQRPCYCIWCVVLDLLDVVGSGCGALNMFRTSLCPSSGEQRPCYCIWRVVLVLLDVVGSGCGALTTIRSLLLTCVSTCFGHIIMPIFRRTKACSHLTSQHPTTATNHIQQNQNNTPNAVTRPLFS